MAEVKRDPQNEAIINVGNNYRIEPGPPLVTETATEELRDNAQTAEHYHAPIESETGITFAKDAHGNPIKLGEEFTYLDWGGTEREGKRIYYIYEKTPVNYTDEFLKSGDKNPYYVPEAMREPKEDSEDRTYYDYIWKEVATRASEEAAIEFAQRKAVD